MTGHSHDKLMPGCYRCDLSRDELAARREVAPWIVTFEDGGYRFAWVDRLFLRYERP